MKLVEKLSEIQKKLKAPKSQFNKFGNYNYRNAEDILEAVKPLLGNMALTISDELVLIGDRYYIKATSTLRDTDGEVIQVSAFAREPQDQKGMNEAQITGSVSSYAKKYSLNGLFCIDDTKDADATNQHGKEDKPETVKPQRVEVQRGDANVNIKSPAAMKLEAKPEEKAKPKFVREQPKEVKTETKPVATTVTDTTQW
jgi:hypothetical protein